MRHNLGLTNHKEFAFSHPVGNWVRADQAPASQCSSLLFRTASVSSFGKMSLCEGNFARLRFPAYAFCESLSQKGNRMQQCVSCDAASGLGAGLASVCSSVCICPGCLAAVPCRAQVDTRALSIPKEASNRKPRTPRAFIKNTL